MDNSEQSYKSTTPACSVSLDSLSPTELWTLSILKSQGFASLSELARHYAKAKDQTVSKESARHYLYRVLQHLEAKGLVELYFDDSRLLTARLKCVPIFYRNFPDGDERKFDLRHSQRVPQNLVIRQALSKKIQVLPSNIEILRINNWNFFGHSSHFQGLRVAYFDDLKRFEEFRKKTGLRVVRRLSKERRDALYEVAGLSSILPKSTIHYDADFLFEQYEKRVKQSVIVLWNDEEGEYLVHQAKTRFTDPGLLARYYTRADKGLRGAFKKFRDAVFVTITVPPFIPLVIRVPEVDGFILLQDSVVTWLTRKLKDFVRHHWKGRTVKTFTAYEAHEDARTHTHTVILGVPFLIDWRKPMGRKKKPALEYYAEKLKLKVTRNLRKRPTRLAKYILTGLLDLWLTEFLAELDSVLGTHFTRLYLSYKEAKGIQGPVNEIHKIRNGKWTGSRPKDARSPDAVRYILKYLLKMIRELQLRALGLAKGLMKLKLLYYWIFSKPFYRPSRGLLGPPVKKRRGEDGRYFFIGIWRAIDLPEYVKPYYMPHA